MNKNITRLADKLGAKFVATLPDTGGRKSR